MSKAATTSKKASAAFSNERAAIEKDVEEEQPDEGGDWMAAEVMSEESCFLLGHLVTCKLSSIDVAVREARQSATVMVVRGRHSSGSRSERLNEQRKLQTEPLKKGGKGGHYYY